MPNEYTAERARKARELAQQQAEQAKRDKRRQIAETLLKNLKLKREMQKGTK
jgi:hypothetical protein